MNDEFKTLTPFDAGHGREGMLCSLPALEKQGIGKVSRLPISIRIVLESVLRKCDGKRVTVDDVKRLANWNAKAPAQVEIQTIGDRVAAIGTGRSGSAHPTPGAARTVTSSSVGAVACNFS